jgi:transposase
MPVYPVAAGAVTACASLGCWCRDRRPCYPSDLTDAQWEVLEPRARLRRKALHPLRPGRRRDHRRGRQAHRPALFQVLRRRWVIERTFGWLMRYRRLTRDYEHTTANAEAMICWATILIMARRLARYENSQPPIKRWGGERTRSVQQTA